MNLKYKRAKTAASLLILGIGLGTALGADYSQRAAKVIYTNDLEKVPLGKPPEEFMALLGDFSVREEGGNRFLELPGAPVDGFSLLFGPAMSADVAVSARIFGTAKGRRAPTFGVGVGGVSGYRLVVSPGRKTLELVRNEEIKASAAFQWQSGVWTRLRLQLRKLADGAWKVEGKAWADGKPEPTAWQVTFEDQTQPTPGRFAVIGSPFAGTPIRFDDLAVAAATP